MKMKKLGLAVATLTVAATLSGCFTDSGSDSTDGQTLRVALQFKPVADFSPFSDDSVLNLRMGVAETLVTLDEDAKLKPVLAEKWEMKDDRTAVLSLRQGVTFHDGSKLDAKAVKMLSTTLFPQLPDQRDSVRQTSRLRPPASMR
ncbi:hypothetical protein CpsigB_05285 [Corynebacterium pseudotuberculosis]|uniref:Solute-binding protein family 5 domain-containing protein n=1 Tax=Corynebacterium pseudotuberculosis (strain C231) TaxID=681645 RepID=A0A6D2LTR9_CORP2|nr:ABC transporter substrate-binding protein [Corynebacterium pseudotuberculosis]QGW57056.1 hypothetical protein CPI19_03650 [Corynebacterium pseudotuberculosis I19]QGW57348.1 hypothetical protein CPFRC_07870 [Corynebacterium pseudotuberculosis FRC41]QHI00972.1 hypothetical protein CPC231_07870 [Corynebacterium pseudotuberculosis C231]QHQ71077.1 hypothetical protein CP1002_05275 [Corynebacterium pseudotuberculosis 1002]AIG09656.1 Putative secreted protein [Corynebacterium pseudotuberculosis]